MSLSPKGWHKLQAMHKDTHSQRVPPIRRRRSKHGVTVYELGELASFTQLNNALLSAQNTHGIIICTASSFLATSCAHKSRGAEGCDAFCSFPHGRPVLARKPVLQQCKCRVAKGRTLELS